MVQPQHPKINLLNELFASCFNPTVVSFKVPDHPSDRVSAWMIQTFTDTLAPSPDPFVLCSIFSLNPAKFHLTGNYPKILWKWCQFLLPYISLLSILSKCLEKHMHVLLLEHIDLLCNLQNGFMKRGPTTVPIVTAVHQWQSWICLSQPEKKPLTLCPMQPFSITSKHDTPSVLSWVSNHLSGRLLDIMIFPWLPVQSRVSQSMCFI